MKFNECCTIEEFRDWMVPKPYQHYSFQELSWSEKELWRQFFCYWRLKAAKK